VTTLSSLARRTALDCTEHALRCLQTEFVDAMAELGLDVPTEVSGLLDEFTRLRAALDSNDAPSLPTLARALAIGRRAWAETLEARALATHHADTLAAIDEQLAAIDALLGSLPEPPPPPRIVDHLTLATALRVRESRTPWLPRSYDPVSRILLNSELFAPDLAHLRDRCSLRELPLALAGFDLDDLRPINARFGERQVDRHLLAPLLTALDRQLYGHAQGYGFGRDDYALLRPNTDEPAAVELGKRLQATLATLPYPRIDARPTISIGIVIIGPEDHRTTRELLRDLELAKRHAKRVGGKNCIAVLRKSGPVVA
jgi:diguanylate cyclase (GGDEF)-like protein